MTRRVLIRRFEETPGDKLGEWAGPFRRVTVRREERAVTALAHLRRRRDRRDRRAGISPRLRRFLDA